MESLEEKEIQIDSEIAKGERPERVVFEPSFLENKEFNDSDSSIKAVISTEHMDRSNDIVDRNGIKFKNFKKNPVVLLNHNRDLVIAKSERLTRTIVDGVKVLQSITKFWKNDFCQDLYEMAKNGFYNAWSISFIPTIWDTRSDKGVVGWDIKESELLEYSMVSIPDNPNALTQKAMIKALRDFSTETKKEMLNNIDINLADELASFQIEFDEYIAKQHSFNMTVLGHEAVRQMEKDVINGKMPDLDRTFNKLKQEAGINE